jgi:hypothetical protein
VDDGLAPALVLADDLFQQNGRLFEQIRNILRKGSGKIMPELRRIIIPFIQRQPAKAIPAQIGPRTEQGSFAIARPRGDKQQRCPSS